MASKQISKELCDERTKHILDKIDSFDKKLDKLINNHFVHLNKDINSLKTEIILIKDHIEDEENKKKEKKEWTKIISPIVTGIVFSIISMLLNYFNII